MPRRPRAVRTTSRLLVLAFFLVVCAVTTSRAAPDEKSRPALQGVWTINLQRSEVPDDIDRGIPKQPIFGPRPGAGGSGPLGGAGMKGPLLGGTKPDPDLRERMRELGHIAFDMPERLSISVDGDLIRIVNERGRVTDLRADGKKTSEISPGGLQIERKTHWDKDRLVTEIKAKGGGGEVKQVFSRLGERLTVVSTFEGEVSPRSETVKTVYDLKSDEPK